MDSPSKPFTIAIEGNIGCGKSTLLNQIINRDQVCILEEPVEKWKSLNGHNLLEKFYRDPKLWATPFDTYVILTTWDQYLKGNDKPLRIIERSLLSCRYCFLQNLLETDVIEQAMFEILEELCERIRHVTAVKVDLIVYLRTDPDVVYQRMINRQREEESIVPIDYLRQLHSLHEQWLMEGRFPQPCPILILDGNAADMKIEYEKLEQYLQWKDVWTEKLF